MAEHTVALQAIEPRGAGTASALEQLGEALGQDLGEVDDTGILEIRVEADDFEGALTRVWNAIAAAGADDGFAFAEHPDVPEHWRPRDDGPGDTAA